MVVLLGGVERCTKKENTFILRKGKWKDTCWKYKMKFLCMKMVSKGDIDRKDYKEKEFEYLVNLETKRKKKGYSSYINAKAQKE
jgi:hypothetical protein